MAAPHRDRAAAVTYERRQGLPDQRAINQTIDTVGTHSAQRFRKPLASRQDLVRAEAMQQRRIVRRRIG